MGIDQPRYQHPFLQRRAIMAWRQWKARTRKMQYVAPILPDGCNRWVFHGFVGLPPKPIEREYEKPLCHLFIAYTFTTPQDHYKTVSVCCIAAGELAARCYTEIQVGDEVMATGKFIATTSRWGKRTAPLLESLEVLKTVHDVKREAAEGKRSWAEVNRGWDGLKIPEIIEVPPLSSIQTEDD